MFHLILATLRNFLGVLCYLSWSGTCYVSCHYHMENICTCNISTFSFCMNIQTPFCAGFLLCFFSIIKYILAKILKFCLYFIQPDLFACFCVQIFGLFALKFHLVWQTTFDAPQDSTQNEEFFLKYSLSCFISALFSIENNL